MMSSDWEVLKETLVSLILVQMNCLRKIEDNKLNKHHHQQPKLDL